MKMIYNWILELLYPGKCTFCNKLLHWKETDLCSTCRMALEEVHKPLRKGSFFQCCYSAYYYRDSVASAIKRYKFAGKEHYAQCFGRLLAMKLLKEQVQMDVITWAPVSSKRRFRRGYDQSQELAKVVGRELGVPVVRMLKKVKHTTAQATMKDPSARLANVFNVYKAVHPEKIRGRRILVIDDVITTGATLNECCRILKMAGADTLLCATFASAGN
ncbi:MAG: ComF family protein [Oscillospiraceae bacterium]|nr:ComF family protein [Oscillospiraceae bacterium]